MIRWPGRHAKGHHRGVVGRLGAAAEFAKGRLDPHQQVNDPEGGCVEQGAFEPVGVEELARLVRRLDRPVGVEEQQVAGTDLHPPFSEAVSWKQPDRQAGRLEPLEPAARPEEELGIMAGVHEAQLAARSVQDADEQRDVNLRRRIGGDLVVHAVHQARQVGVELQLRPKRGLDVRHQERRTHALARHVSDQQGKPAVVEREIVEEVSSDFTGRDRHAGDFHEAGLQRSVRQHLVLNLPAQFELARQAFLLDEHQVVRLELRRHAVEGPRQLADFVWRALGDPCPAIARRQPLHAGVERTEVPREARGKRQDDRERAGDEEQADGQVAERRPAHVPQGIPDRAGEAEDDARRVAPRDHQHVAGERRGGGFAGREPGDVDAERLNPPARLRIDRVNSAG